MRRSVGVHLLGSTALAVGGRFVELGSARQRRLLAALALDLGDVVSADRLADRVWADGELPDDPRRALRTNLARLRQAIGDVEAIVTEPSGWRLDDAHVELDTQRFDELVSTAAEPGIDVHGRLARLDEALALWRGGAYQDMAGEDWVRAESTRLDELRLTAVERRYDAMLAAGMHTDALPGLAGEVDANPLRDRLVGLQMLALYRSGRQAEATRVYEQHRRHLADELGLEPGEKLHELDSRIVAGDPSLHLTSTAGTPLRSYRLGEQLGEGAFAVVYRGTQPSVGRDVAVKVIRAELANRPEFVRRFEAEAHLVARLEHPYIVPLYDYWREPDRACLVFRYLRGGTLEARLTSSGPLSLDECAAMVSQIGAALATAHAEGVVHRDVKPANVFLDEVGNFYLGDFGIALEAAEVSDPTAALSAGSPAYASPEQLRREPVGPSADVHGLGISIYEALTGRLPFPSAASQAELLQHQLHDPIPDVRERRGDVSAAVDAVIQRATTKRPADRYQTVEELMSEFDAALRTDPVFAAVKPGSATVVATAEAHNPYKGLRAFTEADSGDFHGRERLVDRLLTLMTQTGTAGRIVAVVGPSGIGKSSVVRAGLLPALREGRVPTSADWFVATMLPGSHPFDELASALLRVATHAPDNMMGMLTDDQRGIARVVKSLMPEDDGSDLLLVIDQFEELFTLSAQADTIRFLDALEHAITDTRCPLRVVLTMRADFWDRPLRHGAFARLIDGSTVNVTALAPDELERAIVAPAHHFGVEFEPGLVAEIVADVNDQPGALPLLQYALTELWERQVAGVLTRDAYRELGGVTGAVSRRAEELYVESTHDEQLAARRLVGRLITLGEGTEDVRRRAPRTELGDDEATASVIDRFGRARLFSFDHDPTTREPTIEVAHEALIREWPRLRTWLDEDRDDLRIQRHLTDTAAAWLASGRDPGELYRGARLEAAESLSQGGITPLNETEIDFVRTSSAARDLERDHELRRVRRLKRLVAAVAVVAALALIASVFAVVQRNRADDLAVEADVERMAAIARQSDPLDPTIAILLAVEAHRADPSDATLDAVHRALTGRSAYLGQLVSDQVWGITALDDGVRVAVNTTSSVDVWNVETRTREASWPIDVGVGIGGVLAPVNVNGELIYSITPYFSSAATNGTVAAAMADKRLSIVDLSTGASVGDLDLGSSGTALAMSSDGTHLAVGTIDGRMQMFETDDLSSPLWTSQHDSQPTDLEWAPNGQSLASGHGSGEISMFSRGSADPVWTFEGHGEWVSPAADARGLLFSADGRRLVVLRQDQELVTRSADSRDAESTLDISGFGQVVQEFDPSTGAPLSDPMPVLGDEISLRWADRSQTAVLATGARSNLRVYDLAGSSEPRSLSQEGRGEGGASAALLDLDVAVTANRTGMSLHSIRGSDAVSTLVPLSARQAAGDPNALRMIAFDDDTNDVATTVFDFFPPLQQPERFDLDDPSSEPTVMAEFAGVEFDNAAIGFGPTVMMASLVNGIEARKGLDGDAYGPARPIFGTGGGQAALSPNGEREIAWGGGADGALLLFDTATSEVVADLSDLVGDDITWLHFSTDSSRLDIYSSRRGYVFDGVTGELIWAREETGAIISGPGGKYHAVTDGQATIQLLDQATREPVGDPYIGHAAEIFNLDFNTDGSLISSRSADGTVRVWSTESRRQLGREIDAFAANGVVKWSPDGTLMAYPEERGMRVWNYDTASWPEIACEVAGRNLTPAEWEEFGPRTLDYRATCAQYDAVTD